MNNQKFNSLLCKLISTKDPRRIGCPVVSSLTNLVAKTITVFALVVFFSTLARAADQCKPGLGCGKGGCNSNEVCVRPCVVGGGCGDAVCQLAASCNTPTPPGESISNQSFTQILEDSLSFLGPRKTNYDSVASLINLVSNIIVIIAFAVSFATLAFNLIQLITSQGDPKKTDKAKKALYWSIIGMILALVVHALRNVIITMLSLEDDGFFQ